MLSMRCWSRRGPGMSLCPARCAGRRRRRCTVTTAGRWRTCRCTADRSSCVFVCGGWPARFWSADGRPSANRSPGLLERHQRRTVRLTGQISEVARELCGRAAARLARVLAAPVSRSTALRLLRRLPVPRQVVPRVIGVDDFALRRRHRYATIIIDAETGRRVAVLPDREAATLESWLRDHPGVEVVYRDGSAAYAEAVRRVLPDAVQVSDRWHLWRNLCDKVQAEVRAHADCWATINPPRPGGVREQTTRERWKKIHGLLSKGVGLLDCSRRLGLALNTVKRYARMPEPTALRTAPSYRPTLVDPYREHLRRRRAEDPVVASTPTKSKPSASCTLSPRCACRLSWVRAVLLQVKLMWLCEGR
jgi:hypothetical protein